MKCPCSSNLGWSVLAVAGLVSIGIGGYNFASTGCPLGGCCGGDDTAAVVPATLTPAALASEKAHSCCGDKAADACPETDCTDKEKKEPAPTEQVASAPAVAPTVP